MIPRCFIPECEVDPLVADMQPPWLPAAMLDSCSRLAGIPGIRLDEDNSTCIPESFSNQSMECSQWVYPNKRLSIMSEVSLSSNF